MPPNSVGQRDAATWAPLLCPAAPQLWPRDWGSASLQAQLLLQTGAGPMKRTSRLSEGTKSSVLRFAHLLKSLVSFQLSRARQSRETSRGQRTAPVQSKHRHPVLGSSSASRTGWALGKQRWCGGWGRGGRLSLFLSGPLKDLQQPTDGAIKSTLA